MNGLAAFVMIRFFPRGCPEIICAATSFEPERLP